MRNLKSHNESDARKELRADEFLIPAGGIDFSGGTIRFFAAGNDEDFPRKEDKLRKRRENRRSKQRLRYGT